MTNLDERWSTSTYFCIRKTDVIGIRQTVTEKFASFEKQCQE